ncbi:MAG TPA: TonB-dependent receptor [Rhizomicrobium sp.]|nr:TonB-dependent receptor [Rhizomicrobium sp.]
MAFSRRVALIASTILGAGFAAPTYVSAQQAQSSQVEEVVVTAQKREESLAKVPISIGVLQGKDLEAPKYSDTSDALASMAGVAVNYATFDGNSMISIRGISTDASELGGSSPVAYYLDSVPYGLITAAIAPNQNVYDLQRIEVLKGPQGTLYGADSLAGVVRVLTNDADLSSFELKGRVSGSETDDGGGNYVGDAAINVPIIQDKLAVRAVVGYDNESGWIDTVADSHANFSRDENYRFKINAQPTDNLSIGLSAWLGRFQGGAPNTGNDNNHSTAAFPQYIRNNFDAYGVNVAYDLEGYELSSHTTYLQYDSNGGEDLTSVVGFPFPLNTGFFGKVYAEEALINSPADSDWRWSVGGILRRAEEDQHQFLYGLSPFLNLLLTGNAGGYYEIQKDVSQSYAAYGEVTRLFLNDQIEVTGGIRYFHDSVNQVGQIVFPVGPLIPRGSLSDSITPRAVVTWHADPNMMFYLSYSQGFRSGFPQPSTITLPAVKPDTLTTYEAGSKGTAFDNQIQYEFAVYHMLWQDMQESIDVPCCGGIYTKAGINGKASGNGVDVSLNTEPLDGLKLGVAASWNNVTLDVPIVVPPMTTIIPAGTRPNYSPELTGSLTASYDFPLGFGNLNGQISGSANYTSKQHDRQFAITTLGVSPGIGDPMTTSHLAMSVISDNWTATFYINNLNNWNGAVIREFNDPDLYVRIRPRTIGLQLEYNFQ